jgi:hypothetical protein
MPATIAAIYGGHETEPTTVPHSVAIYRLDTSLFESGRKLRLSSIWNFRGIVAAAPMIRPTPTWNVTVGVPKLAILAARPAMMKPATGSAAPRVRGGDDQ